MFLMYTYGFGLAAISIPHIHLVNTLMAVGSKLNGLNFNRDFEFFFLIFYSLTLCSVFEAERPGCRFSVQQRLGTYFFKVMNERSFLW